MSSLAGQTSFQHMNLLPETPLDLHVPGLEFISQVQVIELSGEFLERLPLVGTRTARNCCVMGLRFPRPKNLLGNLT